MNGNCGECGRRWYCDIDPADCDKQSEPVPTNFEKIKEQIAAAGIEELIDSLLYVLDIPEKKQEKVWTDHQYAMPGSLNFSDYDDTERELPRVQTTVGFEGDVWMPVRTSLGLMFIDPAYLKPLKDLDTEPELKERQAANGEIYIAVKRGMELKAVILPIYQGEQLLEELETLTKELSASISRRKMMEQVDPETGEVVEEQNDDQ